LKGQYTLTLGLYLADVRQVVILMGPRILGVAVVQINFLVNTILALSLPEGSVSAVTLAFALMLMPQVAIAQSAAIAAMPTFSAQVALGKLGEMSASLSATLRAVLLLAIPATAGLILLRYPLIRFLYQGGEFTSRSTELVAWALLWYAAGLIGHSLMEILARAFYALHDTRTPVAVGAAAMSLNIAFSFLFMALFRSWGWMPHGGLALANSLATALEMTGLLVLMRRKLGGLESRRILGSLVHGGLGALAMSLALVGWLALTPGYAPWLVACGGVLLGGLVYGLVMLALGVPAARSLLQGLQRRLS
jgi:putative peptidoglycan lipid II flippase